MGYKVKAHFMDVIDDAAGYFSNGQPKKVDELHQGDDVPDGIDELRIKELVTAGAIEEQDDAPDQSPPAAVDPPPAKATGTTTKSTS